MTRTQYAFFQKLKTAFHVPKWQMDTLWVEGFDKETQEFSTTQLSGLSNKVFMFTDSGFDNVKQITYFNNLHKTNIWIEFISTYDPAFENNRVMVSRVGRDMYVIYLEALDSMLDTLPDSAHILKYNQEDLFVVISPLQLYLKKIGSLEDVEPEMFEE